MKRTLVLLLLGLAVGTGSYRLQLHFRSTPESAALDHHLAWMKAELNVSDEQLARLRELHEASEPQMRLLASKVIQLQGELAAFEQTRRAAGEVDFMELGRFVEIRRNVYQECLVSTRQLVVASAALMTPAQRRHYLALVAPSMAAEVSPPM